MLQAATRTLYAAPSVVHGLVLTAGLAGLAFALHALPHMEAVSPAIIAAVGGIGLAHLVQVPEATNAGIRFSSLTLLRLAVVLLGLQVGIEQIIGIGWTGFLILAAGLFGSFIVIKRVGSLLGVEPRLAELIAAGTSICGASAVAATNDVTAAGDEDVAYAVAMVTLFGTLAMLVYPLIGQGLHLDATHYGMWAGASIHEVAQVVGATAQVGPEAEQSGAIAKLARILMLAPLVMGLKWTRGKNGTGQRAPGTFAGVPLFVIGFLALVGLGSVVAIPHEIKAAGGQVSGFLLAMALGGMGLKTRVQALKAKGWAPLLLGAFGALFISLFTLAMISGFA